MRCSFQHHSPTRASGEAMTIDTRLNIYASVEDLPVFRFIHSIHPAMKPLAQSRFTGGKPAPTAEVDSGLPHGTGPWGRPTGKRGGGVGESSEWLRALASSRQRVRSVGV